MKGRFEIDPKQVADMDLTISITMRVSEWQDLSDQLNRDSHPSWRVGSIINDAMFKVNALLGTTFEAGQ